MGIDYQDNHGIGYEVQASDKLLENEDALEDGLSQYLEGMVETGFTIFDTNSGYDTDIEGIYLIIDKPFSKGLDLTWIKQELDDEMVRLEVEPVGELGSLGGMYVY